MLQKMNPEIKAFFESRGPIYDELAIDEYIEFHQFIGRGDHPKYTPIALWSPKDQWEFCFEGSLSRQWYTEKEALRLIRLKAFM